MKKMPCLFARDFTNPRRPVLLRDVTPGCEWVLLGEGKASWKRDGTACAVIGGKLFKRYDAKRGKAPPHDFIACGEPDPVTGHHPGWIPVRNEDPSSKWHVEAWNARPVLPDGTYELCGPKLQANPEGFAEHVFVPHGAEAIDAPRDWDGLRSFLETFAGEGLVFAHPDGRMCKIRRDDYGFAWPIKRDR